MREKQENSHGYVLEEIVGKRHSNVAYRISYIGVRNIVNLRNCQVAIKMYSKAKFHSFWNEFKNTKETETYQVRLSSYLNEWSNLLDDFTHARLKTPVKYWVVETGIDTFEV